MWFNRPTKDRNYSGEQKVSFESPVLFSKCLRAKIYCNMNGHFDPQGCQTLLLKESELFFYLWAPGLFVIRANFIIGSTNLIADSLSRFQIDKFHRLAPTADPQPTKCLPASELMLF